MNLALNPCAYAHMVIAKTVYCFTLGLASLGSLHFYPFSDVAGNEITNEVNRELK
jgi:hypothetical protein